MVPHTSARAFHSRLRAVSAALLGAALICTRAGATETITFEEPLTQPQDVRDQYCMGALNRGVSFLPEGQGGSTVRVFTPPLGASTGPYALTNGFGTEFEELEKIAIRFTAPQSYVTMKVGLDRAYDGPIVAVLQIHTTETPTTPLLTVSTPLGTGPTPITTSLYYISSSANIRSVVVEFVRTDAGWSGAVECIDWLTFSTAGLPCGMEDYTPPTVQITKPPWGLVTHDLNLELDYSADDVGSGVARVDIQYLNALGQLIESFSPCGAPGVPPCGAAPVAGHFYTWMPEATRTVRVRATDFVGLTGQADRQVNYVPLSNVNLWLHGMEVMQSTDPRPCVVEWRRGAGVPWCRPGASLVAGRRTVVRVYPGIEGSQGQTVTAWGELRCKDLYGTACPGPLVVRPGFPVVVDPADNNDVALQRNDANKTLNFIVPESWTTLGRRVEFTATISYELECGGCADGTNSLRLLDLWFQELPTLDVTLVRGCIRRNPNDPAGVCDVVPRELALQSLLSEQSGLVNTFPVPAANIRVTVRQPDVILFDGQFTEPAMMGWMTSNRVDGFLDEVRDMMYGDRLSSMGLAGFFNVPPNFVYFGVIPPPVGAWAGLASLNTGVGKLDAASFGPDSFSIIAHEMGHTLGCPHTSCDHGEGDGCKPAPSEFPCMHGGICVPGFDVYHMKAIPTGDTTGAGAHTHDLMSYGASPWWIAPYSYYQVYSQLYHMLSSPTPAARSGAGAGGRSAGLLIRGQMNPGEPCTIQLAPIYELSGMAGEPVAGSGNARIDLLDSERRVIFTRYFDPESRHGDPPDPTYAPPTRFLEVIPVPWQWDVRQVRVAMPGCTTLTIDRSAHAPELTLLTPQPGEYWATGSTHLISWNGSDSDPRTRLRYMVQYSRDNGGSWTTIAIDHTSESIEVPGSQLAGSSEALVRVLATDGLNTTAAVSGVFTIENQPPLASIISPAAGPSGAAEFPYHAPVVLQGIGTDPEEGPLPGGYLSWYSDRDGLLGTGARVDTRNLSQGLHLVQLIAQDSQGQITVAAVAVAISGRVNSQPIANAGPDRIAMFGIPVTLDGTRSSDRDGDDLAYAWTALWAPPGSAALLMNADQPQAVLFPDVAGQYVLQLVVRDLAEDGLTSLADTVSATAVQCPAGPPDFDGDADVDMDDFGVFQRCYNPSGVDPACVCFDRDGGGAADGVIDMADLAGFLQCVGRPAVPFSPGEHPDCPY